MKTPTLMRFLAALLALATIAAFTAVLADPPAATPSAQTVTVSTQQQVVFPSGRILPQQFTSATRATTTPTFAGALGWESDTGKTYRGNGTTPGAWVETSSGGGAWGTITGTLTDQTDLQTVLNGLAPQAHTHGAHQISGDNLTLDAVNAGASSIIMGSSLGEFGTLTADGFTLSAPRTWTLPDASGTILLDASTLSLARIDTTGATDGQVLTYDSGSGEAGWETGSGVAAWGGITGTLSNQTDLQTALDGKQPIDADLTLLAGNDGSALTALNASQLTTGTVDLARIDTTGAADGQVLAFDSGSGEAGWETSSGGGGGPSTYADWIGAAEFIPRLFLGSGINSFETGTNNVNYDTLVFDPDADAAAQVLLQSCGAFTVRFVWKPSAAAAVGDVVWTVRAAWLADGVVADSASGVTVSVTDTYQADGSLHVVESATVTPSGLFTAGAPMLIEVARNASAGGDTFTESAELVGIYIEEQ